MSVEVEAVHRVTDELVEAARRILPQLSSSAAPLGPDELTRIVGHQAITDQAARGHGAGTALTMAALDPAEQQGARSVDLTSRSSRVAATRLYQRLGLQLRDSNVYRYQPGPRPH